MDSKNSQTTRQQPAQPQYANYWPPLTRKRHTMPHSAQPRHTNHWAPRTRKRHQQEHRSGRQKAATRRNMRREERVTVQGPGKKQQPTLGPLQRNIFVRPRSGEPAPSGPPLGPLMRSMQPLTQGVPVPRDLPPPLPAPHLLAHSDQTASLHLETLSDCARGGGYLCTVVGPVQTTLHNRRGSAPAPPEAMGRGTPGLRFSFRPFAVADVGIGQ